MGMLFGRSIAILNKGSASYRSAWLRNINRDSFQNERLVIILNNSCRYKKLNTLLLKAQRGREGTAAAIITSKPLDLLNGPLNPVTRLQILAQVAPNLAKHLHFFITFS